ncbi:MAG: GAF domain-containing SpoIIE family protein phosphatase, partial [Nocardioidaceae bacterium]
GEEGRGGVAEILDQVVHQGRSWRGDLTAVHGEGGTLLVSVGCSPAYDPHAPAAVLGAVLIAEGARAGGVAEHRLADRLTRLARITAELIAAQDLDSVTRVVVEHGAEAAGATVASVTLLVDDETMALIALRGGSPGTASRWATFPLATTSPATDAVRSGRMVLLRNRREIDESYPDLETVASGDRSMVSLPLRSAGRVLGSVNLSFPADREFDASELEFLTVLADTCASAIDRVNALAEAADQATRLAFLAHASAELASSLDYEATLTKVAQLAVPDYADWCSIQLNEEGDLRPLAVAHVDPAKVALALDMSRRYPPDKDAPSGAYQVLRTGQSELIPEVPDELLVQATVDEEHLRLARELNLRSAMTVPLQARGRVLGVITWVTGDEGRRFGPLDLVFAEELAARASVAIDNAQLHTEVKEAAARLQRVVLPERLPAAEGWEVAAFYLPAGRTDVGGDFYDVLPLDDGRVFFFVGDVMGRGVTAAAAMAQMRSAVRAFVAVDPDPAAVMSKLDLLFARYDLGQLVTLVCAIVEPDENKLWLVSAGHPPMMLLRPDGAVEQLAHPDGPPLGAPPSDRVAAPVPFSRGDVVVAYTDGLVERRTEDIDRGLARLVEAVPFLAADDLNEAVTVLAERVRDHTRDDDVAVIAIRRTA